MKGYLFDLNFEPAAKREHLKVIGELSGERLDIYIKKLIKIQEKIEKDGSPRGLGVSDVKTAGGGVDSTRKKEGEGSMGGHYKTNAIQAIDVVDAYDLNFNLGNVIKYVCRAERKGEKLEDLKKALWYLSREIKKTEGNEINYDQ